MSAITEEMVDIKLIEPSQPVPKFKIVKELLTFRELSYNFSVPLVTGSVFAMLYHFIEVFQVLPFPEVSAVNLLLIGALIGVLFNFFSHGTLWLTPLLAFVIVGALTHSFDSGFPWPLLLGVYITYLYLFPIRLLTTRPNIFN